MKAFILLFFSVHLLGAQKIVRKSIVNAEINAINIDAENCFEVSVVTTDTNEMEVEAIIDGEYRKDLLLNVREEGNTILIGAGFQPNFTNPNDKLSAHKVISIALRIKLPEHKRVTIFGTSSNIKAEGKYRNLKITLNDGKCMLNDISESVEVITRSGDIDINTIKATIKAESKYGKVTKDKIPKGDNRYKVTTVMGNISIKKTE